MPSLFTRHSLLLQTAFSELKRQALEQNVVLIGSPGSVGRRSVKGRGFYYRQFYDAEGRKAAEYIGPTGDAASRRRADAIRDQIQMTTGIAREARSLAHQGYVRTDARVYAILASFANHGLFRAGAVLVGSHAYGGLLNELGVRAAAFATEDVDLARGRALSKAALAHDVDFAHVLEASTLRLLPVPGFGKTPSTSYKARAPDRLRVDLLIASTRAEVTVQPVPELKAHAMAIPHLRPLLESPIEAVLIARDGAVSVRVPRPEAFVWHKMQLPTLRGQGDKGQKDALQAAVLFAVLAEDAPDALRSAHASLSRPAKKRVGIGSARVLAALTPGHRRALELLAELTGVSAPR